MIVDIDKLKAKLNETGFILEILKDGRYKVSRYKKVINPEPGGPKKEGGQIKTNSLHDALMFVYVETLLENKASPLEPKQFIDGIKTCCVKEEEVL